MKSTVDFSHFDKLDIRVGRIVNVEEAATQKPTYRMTVNFGPEIGTKVSCGGYRHYTKEALIGKLVVAVMNLEPKIMGPETSEILILGATNENNDAIYMMPESDVPLGAAVF